MSLVVLTLSWGPWPRKGLEDRLLKLTPREATLEEITACHTPEYVALAREEIAAGERR